MSQDRRRSGWSQKGVDVQQAGRVWWKDAIVLHYGSCIFGACVRNRKSQLLASCVGWRASVSTLTVNSVFGWSWRQTVDCVAEACAHCDVDAVTIYHAALINTVEDKQSCLVDKSWKTRTWKVPAANKRGRIICLSSFALLNIACPAMWLLPMGALQCQCWRNILCSLRQKREFHY